MTQSLSTFWTDVQTTEKSPQSRTSQKGGLAEEAGVFIFIFEATLQKVSHKLGFLPKLES